MSLKIDLRKHFSLKFRVLIRVVYLVRSPSHRSLHLLPINVTLCKTFSLLLEIFFPHGRNSLCAQMSANCNMRVDLLDELPWSSFYNFLFNQLNTLLLYHLRLLNLLRCNGLLPSKSTDRVKRNTLLIISDLHSLHPGYGTERSQGS